MHYVYALQSLKDGHLYVGISANPKARLEGHNSGMSKSTKCRRPFALFYVEKCENRQKAREREKYLKSGAGREFLKAKL